MYPKEMIEGGRGMIRVASGVVTGQDILRANRELLADEDGTRRIEYALIDFSAVTRFEVNPEEVLQVAANARKIAELAPGIALAILAPQDHVFGISRMWETHADETGWAIAVFRTRPEAEAWIAGHRPPPRSSR